MCDDTYDDGIRALNSRHRLVAIGRHLQSAGDRRVLPPLRDDVLTSVRAIIKIEQPKLKKHANLGSLLEDIDLAPSLATIKALLDKFLPGEELHYKLSWHAALLGDDEAVAEVCNEDVSRFRPMHALFQSAFITGLRFQTSHGFLRENWRAGAMDDIIECALDIIRRQRDALVLYEGALEAADKAEIEKQQRLQEIMDEHADALRLVEEDRAEFPNAGSPQALLQRHEVVVIPHLAEASGRDRKNIRDQFKTTAGMVDDLFDRRSGERLSDYAQRMLDLMMFAKSMVEHELGRSIDFDVAMAELQEIIDGDGKALAVRDVRKALDFSRPYFPRLEIPAYPSDNDVIDAAMEMVRQHERSER